MVQILRVNGTTRELGREQGFIPMPVRDIKMVGEDGRVVGYALDSAWELSVNELERLLNGAPLILRLYGSDLRFSEDGKPVQHPPVMMFAGDPQ